MKDGRGRRLTRHRLRAAEAAVFIVGATAIRRLTPMTRWQRLLGRSSSVSDVPQDMDVLDLHRPADPGELDIYRSVRGAAGRLPYDPRCLDRATAAQLMLRLRRRPGVVVIGLARPTAEEVAGGDGDWKAHAWLVGRSGVVTGGPEAIGFVPTSCFIPDSVSGYHLS